MQQYHSMLCMATFRCDVTGVLHISLSPIVSELCSVMPLATHVTEGPSVWGSVFVCFCSFAQQALAMWFVGCKRNTVPSNIHTSLRMSATMIDGRSRADVCTGLGLAVM